MKFRLFSKTMIEPVPMKTILKMNYFLKKSLGSVIIMLVSSFLVTGQYAKNNTVTNPAYVFQNPPASAKPGALWMWMGSNLSKKGITKDLEALKKAGFNRTTMFSLADVTTPWAGEIKKSPTPD